MLLHSGAAFIIVGDSVLIALVGLLLFGDFCCAVIAAVYYSGGGNECAAAIENVE